jgi:hypothetical protein
MSARSNRILGAAALFSGAALVAHILAGVSLRLTLLFTALLLVLAIVLIARRSAPQQRARLRRVAGAGLLAGVIATAAYDGAKFLLSRGTDSPYNPFEAIRAFGLLLAGPSAPPVAIYAAGTSFHLLNGISFGVAFCFLFRRRSLLQGIAWGMFLELFQLTLFPGWLDIRSYREFVQISVLAHLVYGAVLSLVAQAILRESTMSPSRVD